HKNGKVDRTDEASRLVKKLINAGQRTETIAVETGVSNNTVLRWRDGRVSPHDGHLQTLKTLVARHVPTKRAS
ncbi:MAG TPA: hypothetical protein VGD87_07410, partial [Archangium sp.]